MSEQRAKGDTSADATGLRASSLYQLITVRFKEYTREPEALFWSFGFPILLAIGLGIAFRSKPADVVHVAVVNVGPRSAALAASLRGDSGLAVEELAPDSAAVALRTGRVALVVVPSSLGAVQYQYDDTRPDARTARLMVNDAIQRGAGRADVMTVGDQHVRERGSRYIDFVVPGLLGMTIMGGGIWGLGYSIVDQRRKNLLKRLVATPMPRSQYLGSYVISRLIMLTIEVAVLLGFSTLLFGVPMRGSLFAIATIIVLSALAFGGFGLLIASRSKTIEGVSGLMNLSMLPMWVLSGVFFSSENFPSAVQPFIKALPLTATNDALRANMLRGAELTQLWPQMAVLLAWMVVCFAIALRIFRWR
ncbi:MAG: ABC-type multidrug transport system, permease component [Gemmatimonadetes bacterium]|nr:ABC-type multidrug transport system, permease component [Gemmatimonadota bacterium]